MRLLVLAGLLGALAVGCGAKTGLEVPDVPRDAGPDTPTFDAGSLPCIEVPIDGRPVELPLTTRVEVGRADVVFLVDTTASMGGEIDEITANLRDRLAPGIRETIRDSQLAVASFADFPNDPCGGPGDSPFVLQVASTPDVGRVQAAVRGLSAAGGGDLPESQLEALYQVATGEGRPPFVPRSFGCPSGGFGYPCFRSDALPVVLLFTDAPFGDGGRCGLSTVPGYSMVRDALNARDIRVIGIYSGAFGDGLEDLQRLATDTGAVADGRPLVFDIGPDGRSLTESVIEGIRTLASVIELDIDTVLVDPVPGDGVDPRRFVSRVVPLRGEPMSGVGGIDVAAGIFRRVRTGTRVVFQLELRNDVVAPGVGPQRFRLEVVFRGDGVQRLGSREIEIVVPGADGSGC